jgi:hypothetical protein
MTQSTQNQTNPAKDAMTAPNKKEEQSKNPTAGNTPSTDKSSTDKR